MNNKVYYRKKTRRKKLIKAVTRLIVFICIIASIAIGAYKFISPANSSNKAAEEMQNLMVDSRSGKESAQLDYIQQNENKYTKDLISLAERNPEAIQFVYDYPENKDKKIDISIKDEIKTKNIPLLLQWDERWGYAKYGDSIIGINGCGPTCLSMVATYLLKTDYMNPEWMAEYSEDKGFISNSGTLWALMSDGAEKLGLESIQIPLDENRIYDNLEVGNPIICSVGPGDFNTEENFIVLAGIEDGKIIINDPNSKKNSEKRWTYDEIEDQIKNIWVFR